MDTKLEILRTAYEILGRDGLEGLHARSVGVELGINHATVHYHFRSRRDLLLAVVEYAGSRFAEDRQRVLAGVSDAKGQLEAEVALYEAYCRPQSRFFRVWASLFVAGQADDEIKTKLRDMSTVWSESFAKSLSEARKAHATEADGLLADPYLFTASMLGLGLMAQLFGEQNRNAEQFDRVVAQLEGR